MVPAQELIGWDALYVIPNNLRTDFTDGVPTVWVASIGGSLVNQFCSYPIKLADFTHASPALYLGFGADAVRWMLGRDVFDVLLQFAKPTTLREAFARTTNAALTPRDFESIIRGFLYLQLLRRVSYPSSKHDVPPDCGVLTIGIKPKYIAMACSLAETIKANQPELRVALIHERKELALVEQIVAGRALFDELVAVDSADYGIDGTFSPMFMKCSLDELAPFEHTLFIDADTCIFEGADLFRELAALSVADWAPQTTFCFRPSLPRFSEYWVSFGLTVAGIEAFMKESHGPLVNPVYRVHTYFHSFAKSRIKPLFDLTRALYKRTHAEDSWRVWRGQVPDEPLFSVASAYLDSKFRIYDERYTPIAEPALYQSASMTDEEIKRQFVGLTMIAEPADSISRVYDATLASAARKVGNPRPLTWNGKNLGLR